MLNDISPIAHAIEASSYQNTRYTNILDSARTDNVNRDGNDGSTKATMNQVPGRAQNNPYKLGHQDGSTEVQIASDLPRQLFVNNESKGRAMASPSQDNMVSDRSINSNSIHIHFPGDQNTQDDAVESTTANKERERQNSGEPDLIRSDH